MRTASRSGNRSASEARSVLANEIVINVSAGETRVAILEQGSFAELHIERELEKSVAGTVALGRVTRVLPGMQAAFVDVGLEKAAFLYVGDYREEPSQLGGDIDEVEENSGPRRGRGRNGNGRQPAKIESLLREGQEIVVQVVKEPIGSKGARITSHVSIAGRHIVLTPWAKRVGVSRRIESDRERRRLRDIVGRVRPPDLGFIIRTAGEGAREADIEADVRYLTSVWDEIQIRKETATAPAELYAELPLALRVIRDLTNVKTKRIMIDDATAHEEMKDFLSRFVAEPKPRLELYQGTTPIFDHLGIESHVDDGLGQKVWLKSGGHLVIDQSEALTAIDVNTGRFVGKRDLEETVLKTNLEAVKEVVRQLRFRNIGGLIIVDLIDMEISENRDKVYRAFQEALRSDKARTNLLKISELGLVEMTRKRTRENLVQQLCEPCGYCEGRGYVLSSESVAYKVIREIRKDLPRFCGRQIAVGVNPQVAEMLLGPGRKALAELGEQLGREIEIRARPVLHREQFELTALDAGPPVSLSISWLGDHASPKQALEAEAEEPIQADPDEDQPEETAVGPIPTEEEPEEDAPPEAGSPAVEDLPPALAAFGEPAAPGESGTGGEPEKLAAAPLNAELLDVEAESPILPPSENPERPEES